MPVHPEVQTLPPRQTHGFDREVETYARHKAELLSLASRESSL